MAGMFMNWYRKRFSDPQAVFLALFLIIGFAIIITMGEMLTPVLASIVIAYLLEGVVDIVHKRGVARLFMVILVTFVFVALLLFVIFGLLPLLLEQITQLVRELPNYLVRGQTLLSEALADNSVITDVQIANIMSTLQAEIANVGQKTLSKSLEFIPDIVTLMVYVVIVPVLVFFFLKDKDKLLKWAGTILPKDRGLLNQVWGDMDIQIGNYVRGKFWEILAVWLVTFIGFFLLKIKYAMLLSFLVGLSVLIPFIGAVVVTIPVVLISFFQWGLDSHFYYAVGYYLIIQALDGYVLVPLLFSEVVNLHPIAIIVSILVFGGLWGFWGVFFAIPLATLVSAVLKAWPHPQEEPPASA
jgi:putative permease